MSDSNSNLPIHKRPDPCKHYSCDLQKCLFKHNYQMGYCHQILDNMVECCRQWREQSFSCEGFMWMFKDKFEDKFDHKPEDGN